MLAPFPHPSAQESAPTALTTRSAPKRPCVLNPTAKTEAGLHTFPARLSCPALEGGRAPTPGPPSAAPDALLHSGLYTDRAGSCCPGLTNSRCFVSSLNKHEVLIMYKGLGRQVAREMSHWSLSLHGAHNPARRVRR